MSGPINMGEDKFNSFITRTTIKSKNHGEFSGITFAIKDIIDVEGLNTTAGSAILKGASARSNSYIASKILELGGVITGKTNTDEFAMDATNVTSFYGPCLNPNDPTRICGGSSGGSAAAVKACLADVGIGTDTGGSTRIPASLCGVYGFKPTTGSIPMDGVIPFSYTLDTIGILARRLPLIQKVFNNIITTSTGNSKTHKGTLRVGYFTSKRSPESVELRNIVLQSLPEVTEIDFRKFLSEGFDIRRKIVAKEAAEYYLQKYRDQINYFQPQTKKFIQIGQGISQADYKAALQKSIQLKEDYRNLFNDFDLILCPTTEISAPKIADVRSQPDYYRELLVSNTGFFNVVFAPSISLPIYTTGKMPIGLMCSSYEGNDSNLLEMSNFILNKLKEWQVS